jgi:TonB family protein
MRADRRKFGLRAAAFAAAFTLTLSLTPTTDAYGYPVESENSKRLCMERSDPVLQQSRSNTAPVPTDKSRPAKPKGNPGNWIPLWSYPRGRCCRGCPEGVVAFTLTIGTNGRPTKCEITSSSGHLELDEITCPNLMKRAKFDPALEAEGNPVVGEWSSKVHWKYPDPTPNPTAFSP